jgi:hypothetical protein
MSSGMKFWDENLLFFQLANWEKKKFSSQNNVPKYQHVWHESYIHIADTYRAYHISLNNVPPWIMSPLYSVSFLEKAPCIKKEHYSNFYTFEIAKGQLNSEWIYEVIFSPKMLTKKYQDFCPGSLLEGRAEILVIFGWHFGRNDDLMNSFWI